MAMTSTVDRAPRIRWGRATLQFLKISAFLGPALIILGALLVYPIIFTGVRSTFDAAGDTFVGLANYEQIFTNPRTLIAVRNNLIWVLVVPVIITTLGLVFAVLSNRLAWRAAFRMAIFLPLVVSGLAAGVTFRFLFAASPEVGTANAMLRGVVHLFQPPGEYPTARVSREAPLEPLEGGGFVSTTTFGAGDTALLGMVGVQAGNLPKEAASAAEPVTDPGKLEGVVWLDFSPGGTVGEVDEVERGMPGVPVGLLAEDGDRIVARTVTDESGRFSFDVEAGAQHRVQLAASAFRQPYPGIAWLGPTFITISIMLGYIWMQTGFAVVIIGAGLSSLDRELQEAARTDGANEFQVFRHVTVPVLLPILMVVLVTTVINVLKIFDLVFIIAPESMQPYANVLALEMWRASFGGARDFGLGSALAMLLLVMIIPAMIFNIRNFRRDG